MNDNEKYKAQHKNLIHKSEYREVAKQLKELLLDDIQNIEGIKAKIIG